MKRFLLLSFAMTVCAVIASATFGDPPPLTIDAPSSVTTNDPSGADVSFDAHSHLDPPATITCTPPGEEGTHFTVHLPVGDNQVITCTDGTNDASATVTVTYVPPPPPPDKTPPVLTVPGDIIAEATSPSGATVTFSATATDDTDPNPHVSCNPDSGSTFPLGAPTTVNCTATDASSNTTSKSFNVTVHDTTAPSLSLPSGMSVQATSSSGALVTYSASATDAVAGSPPVSCSPPSGSTFPIGSTTVNCSATDGTNPATRGSFTVTVHDSGGPQFSGLSGNLTVEANGPGGSIVNYVSPSAVDAVDGPALVTCAPAPGGMFPLGTTTVACNTSDAHGNTSTASFHVTVADTTPPTLAIPGPTAVYATTPTGIPETAPAFMAFRNAASASDIVDPHPSLSDNLGSFAEVGTHDVGFVARDASGNLQSKATQFIVLPMPPAGTPPLPVPPPAHPPADVPNLQVFPGNGFVRLVWGAVPGAARYLVYRSEGGSRLFAATGHGELVYSGTARTYTDRGLTNGLGYRYVVVSEDAAGNQSAGVASSATPRINLLRSPKDGALLKAPPRLVWARNAEADYYNVQLFRGQVKILSTWPVGASVKLKRTWKYEGRRYKLTKGSYRWYVWPGFGARSAVDYGEMMGSNSFRIVR